MNALTLYVLFLLFAVGGRIAVQYRRTGDHGIRPETWKSSSRLVSIAGPLLGGSLLANFVLSCLNASGLLRPQIDLGAAATWAGTVIGLAGITMTVISQQQMGTAWRGGIDDSERTPLVTHGLFSRIRNPIYAGLMGLGLGVLVLVPHALVLLFLVLQYIAIEVNVRHLEEPHLRRLHGEAYEQYFRRAGRYLPRLFRRT